ncbi:MAG: helix-turn-helix domain-containing protein [Blastocatellia bacterium]
MTLNDYVISVMKEEKLSARQVAKNSNGQITGSYVTRIVRGEVKHPSVDKLRGLADGLNRKHEEVLLAAGGVEESQDAIGDLTERLSRYDELSEIIKTLLGLNKHQLRRVKQFLLKLER